MKNLFDGKTALITGATRGIGRAVSLSLASKGANIIAHYNTSTESARQLVNEIEDMGGRCIIVKQDFTFITDIEQFFTGIIDPILTNEFSGKLDILVNNAGICKKTDKGNFDPDLFNLLMNINFVAPLRIVQESVLRMNDNGRIVNITSNIIKDPDKKYLLYAVSKAAMDLITKAFFFELGKKGITINSVAPGMIRTDMVQEFYHPVIENYLKKRTAHKRIGMAEDISGIIDFLVTSNSAWITGQTIEATGGFKESILE